MAAEYTVRRSQCLLGSTGTEKFDANSGENLNLRIYTQITPWNSLSEAHNSLVNKLSAFKKMLKKSGLNKAKESSRTTNEVTTGKSIKSCTFICTEYVIIFRLFVRGTCNINPLVLEMDI